MRIGEVAERSGVSPSKIRFYETRGLLPLPQRRDNGYREYPPATIATLRFVEEAQALGFSLRDIAAAIPLRQESGIPPLTILPELERKLASTEAHIAAARVLRQRLRTLIAEQRACIDGPGAVTASP